MGDVETWICCRALKLCGLRSSCSYFLGMPVIFLLLLLYMKFPQLYGFDGASGLQYRIVLQTKDISFVQQ